MNLVKVKYVGKMNAQTATHNGKKYLFEKQKPLSIIPLDVLLLIYSSNTVISKNVIPVCKLTDDEVLTMVPSEYLQEKSVIAEKEEKSVDEADERKGHAIRKRR